MSPCFIEDKLQGCQHFLVVLAHRYEVVNICQCIFDTSKDDGYEHGEGCGSPLEALGTPTPHETLLPEWQGERCPRLGLGRQ